MSRILLARWRDGRGRQRDSIEAHLTVEFAALAVSRWIEDRTGWSVKKIVRTARRYRTIEIQAGSHASTAVGALPRDLYRGGRRRRSGARPWGLGRHAPATMACMPLKQQTARALRGVAWRLERS